MDDWSCWQHFTQSADDSVQNTWWLICTSQVEWIQDLSHFLWANTPCTRCMQTSLQWVSVSPSHLGVFFNLLLKQCSMWLVTAFSSSVLIPLELKGFIYHVACLISFVPILSWAVHLTAVKNQPTPLRDFLLSSQNSCPIVSHLLLPLPVIITFMNPSIDQHFTFLSLFLPSLFFPKSFGNTKISALITHHVSGSSSGSQPSIVSLN